MPSFRTPLIALSEGSNPPEKIQLFRTGTFYHESYGKFKITAEILASMAKNFKENVRGIDLALDYMHENESIAAAWIKGVSVGDDGNSLWAEVEWTPRGKQVVSEKEFRYVSPEFHPDYQDNESLKKFGPTLLGAGLTNRPTIKKMEPVMELQEYKEQRPTKPKEIKAMDALDPAKIDSMGPDELKALCKELLGKLQGAQAAEKTAAEKVACMEKDKALSEKKGVFAKMLTEGKAVPAQEEAFLSGDVAKFAELAKPTNSGSGTGSGAAPAATSTASNKEEAQKEVAKLAEAKISEKKAANKGDAISMVLAERKDLREKIYA